MQTAVIYNHETVYAPDGFTGQIQGTGINVGPLHPVSPHP